MAGARFGNLEELTLAAMTQVNETIAKDDHRFHLNNTRTRWTETEMSQTLTFYAVNQGKPAIGLEASKQFPATLRTYYHLLTLETFMEQAGIRFSRDFELTPVG